jgi:hypothetical protein
MPGKNDGFRMLPEFVCRAIPYPSLEIGRTDSPSKESNPNPGPPSPPNGDASPKEPNKDEDKTQPPDDKPVG